MKPKRQSASGVEVPKSALKLIWARVGSGGVGWEIMGVGGGEVVSGSGSSSSTMSKKKRALHLWVGAHFSSQL